MHGEHRTVQHSKTQSIKKWTRRDRPTLPFALFQRRPSFRCGKRAQKETTGKHQQIGGLHGLRDRIPTHVNHTNTLMTIKTHLNSRILSMDFFPFAHHCSVCLSQTVGVAMAGTDLANGSKSTIQPDPKKNSNLRSQLCVTATKFFRFCTLPEVRLSHYRCNEMARPEKPRDPDVWPVLLCRG